MSTTFYDNSTDPVVGTNLFDSGANKCTLLDSFSTPAGTLWTLTALQLVLRRTAGAGNSQINIDLYYDNGASTPGPLAQNLATNFLIAFPDALSHIVPITIGPSITLGSLTRYWIAASDPTNLGAGNLAWNTANLGGGDVGTANESNAGLFSAFCSYVSKNTVTIPFMMKLTGDPPTSGASPVATASWGR